MPDPSEPRIVLTDTPDAADTAVIQEGLRAYNTSRAGYDDYRPLAVFITDPATGRSSVGFMAAAISVSCGSTVSSCPKGYAATASAAACWQWPKRRGGGGAAPVWH